MLLSVTFTAKLESFHFKANVKSISSPKKIVLGIFKVALRLRVRHVFMWQSVKVSNVFYILTLKQIFWKTKTFFQKREYRLKPLKLKTHHFHLKLLCQKPMLRQIERRLQNGPITKSGALPVTTLSFGKFAPVL